MAGGSIPGPAKNVDKPFLQPYYHRWAWAGPAGRLGVGWVAGGGWRSVWLWNDLAQAGLVCNCRRPQFEGHLTSFKCREVVGAGGRTESSPVCRTRPAGLPCSPA